MAIILALGAPPVAVFVSQLLSIGVAFFEHANVRMPGRMDRALRLLFVTPDMHRIHHSQDIHEGESNFSNMFSFWDRLFGTYVDQPAAGHDGIVFGVSEFSERKHLTLPWMLVQPFLSQPPHRLGGSTQSVALVAPARGALPPGTRSKPTTLQPAASRTK